MAHPQTNFSSNFQGAEGMDAELDIKVNGQSNLYRPSGGDQIVELIAPIVFEASNNPTFAQVNSAIATRAPVFIHLTGVNIDYMIPYVGQSGDGNHLYFEIPDAQADGIRYYIIRNGTSPDIGVKDFIPAPTGVVPGTYTKVTVNAVGAVTAGDNLIASDIPNLPASILTSGTLDPDRVADTSIEPIKLKYKKELAVDGRTIQATEVANTVTLSTPEKLQPITRQANYTIDSGTPCVVDIIDSELEYITYSYTGDNSIELSTNVTTDCHALMLIEPVSTPCAVCTLIFTDEGMAQRTFELDMEISGSYLVTIDIRKITYNGTPYSIAKVSYVMCQ